VPEDERGGRLKRLRQWWYRLMWRSYRTILATWEWRDKHYFVVNGALYLLQTNGSDQPGDWVWQLVTYL
jgi:hypothetical protein